MIKNKVDVLVIGAGAAGLGAAAWLRKMGKDFMVMEHASELPLNLHNGVHYLHSIPELPFSTDLKEITLTDGILVNGSIVHTPNLEYALQYSEKVREIQHPSSIMDVGKSNKVYMPKSNTVNAMMQDCYNYAGGDKFKFGFTLSGIDTVSKVASFENREFGQEPVHIEYNHLISSIPLDKFRKLYIGSDFIDSLKLEATPIYITNFRVERIVPNWMINIYIPNPMTPIYRASILNGICSVESIRELSDTEAYIARGSLPMFHITSDKPEKYTWWTGKVISISKDDRAKLIEDLAEDHIHQVGRFGLWDRKLLIDSTINQVKKIVEQL